MKIKDLKEKYWIFLSDVLSKLEEKKMTNKEAIEILKNKMDGSIDTSYSWCETIRLAIQALEKTDYLNCEIPLDEYGLVNHYKSMDDQDKLIVAYLAKRFAETPLIKRASYSEIENK